MYEIKVKGHMSPTLISTLEAYKIKVGQGYSHIKGDIEDQSRLHGLLNQLFYWGFEVISVKKKENENEAN